MEHSAHSGTNTLHVALMFLFSLFNFLAVLWLGLEAVQGPVGSRLVALVPLAVQ
jgi:hypothetical protein